MKYAVLIILLAANAAVFRWLWRKSEVGSTYLNSEGAQQAPSDGLAVEIPDELFQVEIIDVYELGYVAQVDGETGPTAGLPQLAFTYNDFRVGFLAVPRGAEVGDSLVTARLCAPTEKCTLKWARKIKSIKPLPKE